MLLVAPDPRLGIAPERIGRVRTLLDGLPTAPGFAVALPGGPDGELDAVVLRPDGVLGLVPAAATRRVGVGAGAPDGGGAGSQEMAAAELDRLLALTDPTPTAPRQVVPIVDRRAPATSRYEDPERTDEDTGVGVATAARLVLTASAGPTVLDAVEVRRLLVAWRVAEFLPDGADLRAAGFPGGRPDGGSGRPGPAALGPVRSGPPSNPPSNTSSNPPSGPPGPSSHPPSGSLSAPRGPSSSGSVPPVPTGPGGAVPAVVPAARSALASSPGGAPEPPGPSRTGSLPVGTDEQPPRPPTAPLPVAPAPAADVAPGPLGPWGIEAGSRTRRRREQRARRLAVAGWLGTWRGLGIAAVVTFGVALGVAVLVVRGGSSVPEETAALPVRVVDGVSWTERVVTTEPTCEGHAYGLAVQFLREHPCVQLDRALWSGDVGGSAMVASVAVVRMPDVVSAAAFKALVDSSGTGNVADLLREGRGFVGAPASLGNAGYGSTQLGESVVITETAPGAGTASPGESTLDRVARQATGLR
jgi:hypothetical protein